MQYPKILKKKGSWDMEHWKDGIYFTTQPKALVPRIGAHHPKKKAMLYDNLIKNGYGT